MALVEISFGSLARESVKREVSGNLAPFSRELLDQREEKREAKKELLRLLFHIFKIIIDKFGIEVDLRIEDSLEKLSHDEVSRIASDVLNKLEEKNIIAFDDAKRNELEDIKKDLISIRDEIDEQETFKPILIDRLVLEWARTYGEPGPEKAFGWNIEEKALRVIEKRKNLLEQCLGAKIELKSERINEEREKNGWWESKLDFICLELLFTIMDLCENLNPQNIDVFVILLRSMVKKMIFLLQEEETSFARRPIGQQDGVYCHLRENRLSHLLLQYESNSKFIDSKLVDSLLLEIVGLSSCDNHREHLLHKIMTEKSSRSLVNKLSSESYFLLEKACSKVGGRNFISKMLDDNRYRQDEWIIQAHQFSIVAADIIEN